MQKDGSQQRRTAPLRQRILRSILPEPVFPTEDAQRRRFLLKNLFLHFRPISVPEKTLRLSLTWGLGGMAAVLVLLQFGTGVLLKFGYEPTPMAAYPSIQAIITDIPFGGLVRNLHHWGAHLLVVMAFLHLLRVFFTGAFHAPRQFNWVVGLGLFCTILFANLTGYLLPWDQLAYWAVTVSTGMLAYIPLVGGALQELVLGGAEINAATLRNFFALHTAVVPVVLAALMAFHFWRVRKAGGLVIPRSPGDLPDPQPTKIPTVPNLLVREASMALVLVAALVLTSSVINAPLGGPANPGLSPNPVRAPWYFAGIQELLLHLHPTFAVCVIPLAVVAALALIPYWKHDTDTGGIWFASAAGRKTAVAAALIGALLTLLMVITAEWFAGRSGIGVAMPPILLNGLIPAAVLGAALIGVYSLLRRRQLTTNEAVQTIVVFLVVAYGVLTMVNIWFRGEGMAFRWPWWTG